MDDLLGILISIISIIIGFFVGGARERKHIADLQQREKVLLTRVPTRNIVGQKVTSGESFLVVGSVVVASDAFKEFVGNLKNIFGGKMGAQEALLDRARREAVCRMREQALIRGGKEVVDVHIETSFLDQMGVEVTAYGTALRP